MAKGDTHGMERIEFTDPQTGAHIVQLTSNVTMSSNLYFEECPFTPDSQTLIFVSRRSAERKAPRDLFRVNADGSDLIQLTDCDGGIDDAVLSLDGTTVFLATGTELRRVDMEDFREDVVERFDGINGLGQLSVGGEHVFATIVESRDSAYVYRCRADGLDGGAIHRWPSIGHMTASRTGRYVSWIDTSPRATGGQQVWHVMRSDGSDEHPWAATNWSHSSWVGDTDRMQGALLTPDHGLSWIGPEETEPQIVATGPYFSHSSASLDGEWIVGDTNWPNIGLQLVHIPSGRFQTLCLDLSSYGHPQYTHPHPVFSRDGEKVLYNSDRTGVPQVYVATIPDYLKDELRTGQLLNRHRIGPRTA